ncbi:hypothetical protein ACFQBY_00295 [Promicromonospora citrea]
MRSTPVTRRTLLASGAALGASALLGVPAASAAPGVGPGSTPQGGATRW